MNLDYIIGHLVDCFEGTREANYWTFVRKDVVAAAVKELDFYNKHGHEVCVNCPLQPVKITMRDNKYYCGACGKRIPHKIKANFCPKCGRQILWIPETTEASYHG